MAELPRIGFFGTGIMGHPMARNLLKAGHRVAVWNRTPAKYADLLREGATAPGSPRAVAAASDVLISIFMGPEPLDAILDGPDGVRAGLQPGSVFLDMGTHPPRNAQRLAALFATHGVASLDAPVRGGVGAAVDATLLIMAGGDEAAYRHVLPVLQTLGKAVYYAGPAGSGQIAKACHQLVVLATIEAVAEALALAKTVGADQASIREIMLAGQAASAVLERQGADMVARQFTKGRPIHDYLKDNASITDALRGTGLVLPVTDLVMQRIGDMVASGKGDLSESGLYTLLDP